MTLNEVLNDIKTLVEVRLNSIRPGAEITVTEVNNSGIRVRRNDGSLVFRSIHEFERILEALNSNPGAAVHVDAVLKGGGSSRNHPETVFANLPYIEVIYINRKKHIKLVSAPSHAIGTIRVVDQ